MTRILAGISIGFLLTREGQLVHHYIVINRDYYPVMSYFWGQGLMYLRDCVETLAMLYMTAQCGKIQWTGRQYESSQVCNNL